MSYYINRICQELGSERQTGVWFSQIFMRGRFWTYLSETSASGQLLSRMAYAMLLCLDTAGGGQRPVGRRPDHQGTDHILKSSLWTKRGSCRLILRGQLIFILACLLRRSVLYKKTTTINMQLTHTAYTKTILNAYQNVRFVHSLNICFHFYQKKFFLTFLSYLSKLCFIFHCLWSCCNIYKSLVQDQ